MSKSKDDFFDWAYDTRHYQNRNLAIAWGIAAAFAVLSICCIIALIALTPLKTTVPYVFTVDEATGIVEPQTSLMETQHLTPSSAEDFANVARYIRLRDSYLYGTYPGNYEQAVKMSTGVARTDLVQNYAPNGPLSPMRHLQDRGQADVRFKSISYHGQDKNIAIARYVRDIKTPDGIATTHHVATVQFEYATAESLSLALRLMNPHAFVVTHYQSAEEGQQ